MKDSDLAVQIFKTITTNWQGSVILFPHKGKGGEYRNVEIKASDILDLIRKQIKESEK